MTLESELEELKQLLDLNSDEIISDNIQKKISKIDKKISKLESKFNSELNAKKESTEPEPPQNITSIIEELGIIEKNINSMMHTNSIDKLISEFAKFKSKLDLIDNQNEKDYKLNLEYL
jgi:hypothetical protein